MPELEADWRKSSLELGKPLLSIVVVLYDYFMDYFRACFLHKQSLQMKFNIWSYDSQIFQTPIQKFNFQKNVYSRIVNDQKHKMILFSQLSMPISFYKIIEI